MVCSTNNIYTLVGSKGLQIWLSFKNRNSSGVLTLSISQLTLTIIVKQNPRKILIVDDESDITSSFDMILQMNRLSWCILYKWSFLKFIDNIEAHIDYAFNSTNFYRWSWHWRKCCSSMFQIQNGLYNLSDNLDC